MMPKQLSSLSSTPSWPKNMEAVSWSPFQALSISYIFQRLSKSLAVERRHQGVITGLPHEGTVTLSSIYQRMSVAPLPQSDQCVALPMVNKSLKWKRGKYSQRKNSYCNTALVHIKDMESARTTTTAAWVKNNYNRQAQESASYV